MTRDQVAQALTDEVLKDLWAIDAQVEIGPYEAARNALLSALAPLLDTPRPTWQSMATAPKDGTRILLYETFGDDGPPAIAAGFYKAGWIVDVGDGYGLSTPTHWQPLPPPPGPEPR